MILVNILRAFIRAITILREEGFILLVKRMLERSVNVYENTLDGPRYTPKVGNCNLKIISTEEQLNRLIADDFDMSFYFSEDKIRESKGRLNKGAILFCAFIKWHLAHISWVLMNNRVKVDNNPLVMDYRNEAYIGGSETNPEYQGLGIYTYVMSEIYEFLRNKGRRRARFTISKGNVVPQKAQAKLGSKLCRQGSYVELFLREFLKRA